MTLIFRYPIWSTSCVTPREATDGQFICLRICAQDAAVCVQSSGWHFFSLTIFVKKHMLSIEKKYLPRIEIYNDFCFTNVTFRIMFYHTGHMNSIYVTVKITIWQKTLFVEPPSKSGHLGARKLQRTCAIFWCWIRQIAHFRCNLCVPMWPLLLGGSTFLLYLCICHRSPHSPHSTYTFFARRLKENILLITFNIFPDVFRVGANWVGNATKHEN